MKMLILSILVIFLTNLIPVFNINAQSIGVGISTSQEELKENLTKSGHSVDGYKKSIINQELIVENEIWIPTDYVQSDIQANSYTVQLGDTLWEIAEGFYGDGFRWNEILTNNPDKVKQFEDGSYGLIYPGDILKL